MSSEHAREHLAEAADGRSPSQRLSLAGLRRPVYHRAMRLPHDARALRIGSPCLLGLAIAITGCGPSLSIPGGSKSPTTLGSLCDIQTKSAAPLIVDWNSSQRSRLESAVRNGKTVAVKVSGCDIEPLWQCQVPGAYRYEPSSVRRDRERIADRASLFARVPVSAVGLEGKLSGGNELQVEKATVGRFVLDNEQITENQLQGHCGGATHFISGVDVGAFSFSVVSSSEASGSANARVVQAGGEQSSQHEVLSTDGTLAQCDQVEPGPEPDVKCRAPIQISLTPLVASLSKQEFLEAGVKGSVAAYRRCTVEKGLKAEVGPLLVLYLVAQPDGTISARFPPPGPTREFYDCVISVWNEQRVEPFSGPELVLAGTAWSSGPEQGNPEQELRDVYLHNFSLPEPGIPPQEVGKQIYYDFAKNGVTATDVWQPISSLGR